MAKLGIGCVVLLLIFGVAVAFWVTGAFNTLVTAEETVNEKWAQVENVYQRRADLIPNLVETVRGASEFEQETLIEVVEARSRIGGVQVGPEMLENAEAFSQFQAAQDSLSSALSRLLVVVERYPELRSVAAFQDLMVQLEGTENRIAVERNRYNVAAREFNTQIKRVPTRWFVGLLGWEFGEKTYFESRPGAEEAPAVEF